MSVVDLSICVKNFGTNWRALAGKGGRLPALAEQHSQLHLLCFMDCRLKSAGVGHKFILLKVFGNTNACEEKSHGGACSIGYFLLPLLVPDITSLRPLT